MPGRSDRAVFSMRLGKRTLRELKEEAARYREPVRTVAERMLEESVRMARFPGITFIDRAAARQAVLIGRPRLSVWMVVLAVRGSSSRAAAAKSLRLHVGAVDVAMAYAKAYSEEIERELAENDAAFERVKRLYPSEVELTAEWRRAPRPR